MAEAKKILVVDDDQIILESLREFLSLEGYQADGAESMKEAVSKLQNEIYNLVITDVHLPDGDGFELLEMIKKNRPFCQINQYSPPKKRPPTLQFSNIDN